MGNYIWGPYGAYMDVPRWVPDESLLQNPHRSHMGCPYRTHIITHLGPIWVPHSLLAGHLLDFFSQNCKGKFWIQILEITQKKNCMFLKKILHSFP